MPARFIAPWILVAIAGAPLGAQAQAPHPIRTPEDAAKLGEHDVAASIDASGARLTRILEEVVRRAPRLRRLSIRHGSSTTLETRSLGLLRGLERLEHLSLSGDAFLYDEEFAALGRISQLSSLRLALP